MLMRKLSFLLSLVLFIPLVAYSQGKGRVPQNAISADSIMLYVGRYPCSDRAGKGHWWNHGFLAIPFVRDGLKGILGKDYKAYLEFLAFSGCGPIESTADLLSVDLSQLHVGGYDSILFVNIVSKDVHLFWLNGTVGEKNYKIYGRHPVPSEIMKMIVDNMNSGWGHVANFTAVGDSIAIEMNR